MKGRIDDCASTCWSARCRDAQCRAIYPNGGAEDRCASRATHGHMNTFPVEMARQRRRLERFPGRGIKQSLLDQAAAAGTGAAMRGLSSLGAVCGGKEGLFLEQSQAAGKRPGGRMAGVGRWRASRTESDKYAGRAM